MPLVSEIWECPRCYSRSNQDVCPNCGLRHTGHKSYGQAKSLLTGVVIVIAILAAITITESLFQR